MKRPANPNARRYHAKHGDIKGDFSPEQRQALGEVALNFNEMEGYVDVLLAQVTNIPDALALEVSTRINGLGGKIEIIKEGANALDLADDDLKQLQVALGEGLGFMGLKGYRDAVIHARALNAPEGVAFKPDSRGTVTEVLITKTALEALYKHITARRLELRDATYLILAAKLVKGCAPGDPARAQLEVSKSVCSAQFRENRKKRQSLPPLPEFPLESQLIAARDAWFQARIAEQTVMIQPVSQTATAEVIDPPSPSSAKKKRKRK